MNMAVFFFVPVIIFMGLVAPLWLVLHYLSKRRSAKGLVEEDRVELDDLLKTADKLTDRIEILERILDADSPNWRDKEAQRAYRSHKQHSKDEHPSSGE
ncbi:phage shock protein B [Marinomonas sp. 42_23_T18]|nr:phage shock protein B [Marinomonas sp. 42_23_T18]